MNEFGDSPNVCLFVKCLSFTTARAKTGVKRGKALTSMYFLCVFHICIQVY